MHEHEEKDANDDAAMCDEEADESRIAYAESEIRSDDGLEGAPDPPKISHFKPGAAPRPHRGDNDQHGPVAQLERQGLGPGDGMKMPNENNVGDVIEQEQSAQANRDNTFDPPRLRHTDKASQQERYSNRQRDNGKVRKTERLECVVRTHRKIGDALPVEF